MTVRVLISHDSPAERFWLKTALRQLCVDFVEADGGVAFEARLRDSGPFDLIVVKAMLPGAARPLSGFGCPVVLVHEIRGHHAMISVKDTDQMVVSARALCELVQARLGPASIASAKSQSVPAPASVRSPAASVPPASRRRFG